MSRSGSDSTCTSSPSALSCCALAAARLSPEKPQHRPGGTSPAGGGCVWPGAASPSKIYPTSATPLVGGVRRIGARFGGTPWPGATRIDEDAFAGG